MRFHPILSRIFYSTSFSVILLVTLALVVVTPADAVYQAFKANQIPTIFIIAGVYILTALLAILIYASRIYTNRSVLASIPKAWIPVEKGDVGRSVRRVIADGLARSAIIAYEAKPRDIRDEVDLTSKHSHDSHEDPYHVDLDRATRTPTWGEVAHPGWSSPSSPDLPSLQYESVIDELPNLIEAKAVSLAPADPVLTPHAHNSDPYTAYATQDVPAIPDARIVEVLQRPATMGLRDYIGHLTVLNLINPPELGPDLLALYERARFSTKPLKEEEFRAMMSIFAEILRGMTTLDPALLAQIQAEGDNDLVSYSGTSDEEGETDTIYHNWRNGEFEEAGAEGFSETGSVLRRPPSVSSSESGRSIRTAPLFQRKGSSFGLSASRNPVASATRIRTRTPSSHSLRPTRSNVSARSTASGGSVIRLAEPRTPQDLPYTIEVPGREAL